LNSLSLALKTSRGQKESKSQNKVSNSFPLLGILQGMLHTHPSLNSGLHKTVPHKQYKLQQVTKELSILLLDVAFSNMLLAWYYAGYYTGQYQVGILHSLDLNLGQTLMAVKNSQEQQPESSSSQSSGTSDT
jgi:hypothetical protein